MAESIDEISITYEEDGEIVLEELEKVVLTRGAWTTILFRYREKDRKTGEFGPSKATLRRFQKYKGVFKKKDSINLSDQVAGKLIDILSTWKSEGLLGQQDSEESN